MFTSLRLQGSSFVCFTNKLFGCSCLEILTIILGMVLCILFSYDTDYFFYAFYFCIFFSSISMSPVMSANMSLVRLIILCQTLCPHMFEIFNKIYIIYSLLQSCIFFCGIIGYDTVVDIAMRKEVIPCIGTTLQAVSLLTNMALLFKMKTPVKGFSHAVQQLLSCKIQKLQQEWLRRSPCRLVMNSLILA